ncbi:MAG: PTS sugar transporter subunit IIB [Dorea sp.]|jgi:mannose/fructose/N-acetylgalactosamine-specific phosphotransferase system component IIB|nr:PTS sugar transporter subunit IIB [Dorea sp.]
MRNVVLARVDDRLIHGEVVTAWTPTYRANKIIIVDDEVAKDQFNVRVVKALAPAGTKVIVYNVEKAAEKLMVPGVDGERLLVLAKTPITYSRLVKAGVPIKEVNLGGAGIRGERQPFINNVALNPDEVLACEEMKKAGVHVFYQLVPEQGVIEIDEALKKAKANFGL